jgi:hypothetical protein
MAGRAVQDWYRPGGKRSGAKMAKGSRGRHRGRYGRAEETEAESTLAEEAALQALRLLMSHNACMGIDNMLC